MGQGLQYHDIKDFLKQASTQETYGTYILQYIFALQAKKKLSEIKRSHVKSTLIYLLSSEKVLKKMP